jgi:IrrE N-terminal-like domain
MSDFTASTVLPSEASDSSAAVLPLHPRRGAQGARVLSWLEAHRIANIAAAQAHHELGVDLTGTRVDIIDAIRAYGPDLMWQPMPTLFGAYLNEDGSTPGFLINSELPRGARRHTAAHELGHAYLKHSTTVDDGSTIETVFADEVDAIPPANRRRAWPDQEKTAEAFAAWFLMPRRVLAAALNVLELNRPGSPADVYRLSLLVGTSYRSTLRHLPNVRLATNQSCNAWARVSPGRIKAQLDHGAPKPASRRPDVHVLTNSHNGLTLELEPGDRLVMPCAVAMTLDPPKWLLPLPVDGDESVVFEVAHLAEAQIHILATRDGSWSIDVLATPPPRGIDPRETR